MTKLRRSQQDAASYRHVLWLLFAAHLLSFADRIVFGLVLKPIKVALAITDSQAGILTGAAFAIAYAICSPLGGYVIDRTRRRPVFAFAVAFWSVATFSSALATSFLAMVVARACVGLGEALLHPLGTTLIGDTVPIERRTKAFAIYFSAGAFGTVGVLLFGGALFQYLSGMPSVVLPIVGAIHPWQALFIACAVPGLLLALAILLFMKEPARASAASHTIDSKDGSSIVTFIRANPKLTIALYLGYPLAQTAANALMGWMFVFFERVHELPPGKVGVVFALTSGPTMIVGSVLGGHIIGLLRRWGYEDAPLRACIVGGVAFTVLATVALLVPTVPVALTFFALSFLFSYLPTIGAYAAIGEIVPPSIRAQAGGMAALAVGLTTSSLGPFLIGYLSDHLYQTLPGIRWSMVTVAVTTTILGTMLIVLGLQSFRNRRGQSGDLTDTAEVGHGHQALGRG